MSIDGIWKPESDKRADMAIRFPKLRYIFSIQVYLYKSRSTINLFHHFVENDLYLLCHQSKYTILLHTGYTKFHHARIFYHHWIETFQ